MYQQNSSLLESKNPRILISGGGTGGHVFPAIAIADAIKVQFPNAAICGCTGKVRNAGCS
jgi:UDP:flavonoid glycosyltransferase YjiC (YdhE family)